MISWVMFAGWLGVIAYSAPKLADHPLGTWRHVSSEPYVQIVNLTPDSIPACAIALDVDHAIRCLGWTQPMDSSMWRLPYADTWVVLLIGTSWVRIDARKPGLHRIVVRPVPGVPSRRSEGEQ